MNSRKKVIAIALALSLLAGCTSPSAEKPKKTGTQGEASSFSAGGQDQTLTKEDLEKLPFVGEGTWVSGKNGEKWYKNKGTFYGAFDTAIQLTAYTKDENSFKQIFTLCQNEFQRLHQLYDNYHEYQGVTNLMTLNRTATKAPVQVEDDLFALLQFSKENYTKTLGKVNIAMGKTLAIWHDLREAVSAAHEHAHDGAFALPTKEALEEANRHSNLDDVILDATKKTVKIQDPDLALDAGAVAKGYATERVAETLKAAGLEHGIISAGGNIKTIGAPIDDRPQWKVGIMHPRPEKKDVLATVMVAGDTAMVTSGDYQRYFELDGVRYAHIIDPVTLYPAKQYTSVTIRTADSGLADFLSTAFFIANAEEAQQILANYADAGVEVIWVDQAMEVTATQLITNDITLVP